ncbi:hypothetical protein M9458_017870, partial [Cirrhinus mrigala]
TEYCHGTLQQIWSISSPTQASPLPTPPCPPQPPLRPILTSAHPLARCPITTRQTPANPVLERRGAARLPHGERQ